MQSAFKELIRSSRVSDPTQEVLTSRIEEATQSKPASEHSDAIYATLSAVSGRLIPQTDQNPIDLAEIVLSRMRTGTGNGWRYAEMPPDPIAFLQGLLALEESSQTLLGKSFPELTAVDQAALLTRAQNGELHWAILNSSLWFEELLSDLVEAYVSQPYTMALMGFDGFAFLPEWPRIGLDSAEPWEPQAS